MYSNKFEYVRVDSCFIFIHTLVCICGCEGVCMFLRGWVRVCMCACA